MEKFKALLAKKRDEGKGLDGIQAHATGSVLHDMMKALDSDGLQKVKGLKKVTVASNDPDALEEGLDKAKSIVHEGEDEIEGGDEHDDHLLKHELEESPEYDDEESEEAEDDSPVKHIDEAEAHDPMSMHAEDSEDREALPEGIEEGSPEHIQHLKKQLEDHKKEIASLRSPKSFY
jgi:hypothetical protein